MTAKLIAVIIGASLLALLDGCTIKFPLDELREYPAWMVAPRYRHLLDDTPPIIVPVGTDWSEIA